MEYYRILVRGVLQEIFRENCVYNIYFLLDIYVYRVYKNSRGNKKPWNC